MATIKRILVALLVGAGIGTFGALLVSPGIIEWWSKPAIPTVCSCVEQVHWALGQFRGSLAIASGVSALLVTVVTEIGHRRRSRRGSAPLAQPPPPRAA